MKKIILLFAVVAVTVFAAECTDVLSMTKSQLNKKIDSYISQMDVDSELKSSTRVSQREKAIEIKKCMYIRDIKTEKPYSMKRINALVALETIFLSKQEEKIKQKAIDENREYFKGFSVSLYIKSMKGKPIHFGVEMLKNGDIYVAIRTLYKNKIKIIDTKMTMSQFEKKVCSSNSKTRKYIFSILKQEFVCQKKVLPKKFYEEEKSKARQLNKYIKEGELYLLENIDNFIYVVESETKKKRELKKGSVIKVISSNSIEIVFCKVNDEAEVLYEMKPFSLEKFSKLIKD